MAKNNDLGTNERIRGKIEKMKQDDAVEIQGLRDSLSVLQAREKELHQQLEEANRRLERASERAEVKHLKVIMVQTNLSGRACTSTCS